ncbi:hypothetical protein OIV83_005116 [Microbotryomycetes sp. JL201]|nr:hypothetical protein OIV83_005116 [Microbotryomycetes sp. JL201]
MFPPQELRAKDIEEAAFTARRILSAHSLIDTDDQIHEILRKRLSPRLGIEGPATHHLIEIVCGYRNEDVAALFGSYQIMPTHLHILHKHNFYWGLHHFVVCGLHHVPVSWKQARHQMHENVEHAFRDTFSHTAVSMSRSFMELSRTDLDVLLLHNLPGFEKYLVRAAVAVSGFLLSLDWAPWWVIESMIYRKINLTFQDLAAFHSQQAKEEILYKAKRLLFIGEMSLHIFFQHSTWPAFFKRCSLLKRLSDSEAWRTFEPVQHYHTNHIAPAMPLIERAETLLRTGHENIPIPVNENRFLKYFADFFGPMSNEPNFVKGHTLVNACSIHLTEKRLHSDWT